MKKESDEVALFALDARDAGIGKMDLVSNVKHYAHKGG